MSDDDKWFKNAVARVEHQYVRAVGGGSVLRFLRIAEYINDIAIGGPRWGRRLRDKYLKFTDEWTGERVLEPYILVDLARRESNGAVKYLTPEQRDLAAKILKEMNEWRQFAKIEELDWWNRGRDVPDAPSQSIEAISGGFGTKELDAATRYKTPRKPKTWNESTNIESKSGIRFRRMKDGTVQQVNSKGRVLPTGDMTGIRWANHRQRIVFEDLYLAEPPKSRAETARKLGIDPTQISRICRQVERKIKQFAK
jgi:hypothetical protein